MFENCDPRRERAAEVNRTVSAINANRPRYETAAREAKVPWHFVALVHCMEAGLKFDRHLHNGDPLTARTVRIPAGRPLTGEPPFPWEASAADALRLRKLDKWADWSLAGTLFQLEGYNGWGYRLRKPSTVSPYLWSYSGHYSKGKFTGDGKFDAEAISLQCGAAVLLRELVRRGAVTLAPPASEASRPGPVRGG